MITRLRREDGSALITALMMVIIVLGIGFAVLAYTDNQTHAAAYEQQREQAYALAEAALNAQIFQLSTHWPSTAASAYPASCTPTTAATTTGCPNPSNLAAAYPVTGTTCRANAPTDPWSGSSTTTNGWATYVRDDGSSGGTDTSQLFNSSADLSQPQYDANGDNVLWVRAVGVVNCRMVTVLSKVSAQFAVLPLPEAGITANGFATANNGNKIIVDTIGTYAQPTPFIGDQQPGEAAPIDMRCGGLTTSACESFRNSPSPGQVYPNTATPNAGVPAVSLTTSQINALRSEAEMKGTYFGTDPYTGYSTATKCPTTMAQLTGDPVFVEGPCNIYIKSQNIANSATSPGVLAINNGTLTLDGGATFFGVLYMIDAQGAGGAPCSGSDVLSIQGSSEVQGAMIVDGSGTVCFGSSGNGSNAATNFVYDDRGFKNVIGWMGAAGTPNSFRVLPQGQ
jgi:Tfp pilus assembly protein PilX